MLPLRVQPTLLVAPSYVSVQVVELDVCVSLGNVTSILALA